MIKAVIFDLNGVFLKSAPLSTRFEEKYGVSSDVFVPALKEILDQVRVPNAPPMYPLWKKYFSNWGLNISEDEFYRFWFSGEHIVPELIKYTDFLRKKNIRVFILSNNLKERTDYYRIQFPDFFTHFDQAYFSWETGFVKPNPKAFENILSKNGLKPAECVYFDDSDVNIDSAIKLGINARKFEGYKKMRHFMQKTWNLY